MIPRIGFLTLLAGLAAACGAATPTPTQQIDESSWAALDSACISSATTKAQLDICYDANRERYCGANGALADSGACVHVHLSDGGAP